LTVSSAPTPKRKFFLFSKVSRSALRSIQPLCNGYLVDPPTHTHTVQASSLWSWPRTAEVAVHICSPHMPLCYRLRP